MGLLLQIAERIGSKKVEHLSRPGENTRPRYFLRISGEKPSKSRNIPPNRLSL
jgi:hypothetical protein